MNFAASWSRLCTTRKMSGIRPMQNVLRSANVKTQGAMRTAAWDSCSPRRLNVAFRRGSKSDVLNQIVNDGK